VHGTLAGERLLFTQDRYFIVVRDLNGTAEPERRNLLINFGAAISARIPRGITDLPLLAYLPLENRVPGSERLSRDDPLGLGALPFGAVTARYRGPGQECKVFVADFPSHLELRGALKTLKAAMLKEGPVRELAIGDEGWQGRLLKSPGMIARRETVLFGAFGACPEEGLRALLAVMDRRIKPYVPPPFKEKPKEEEKPKAEGRTED